MAHSPPLAIELFAGLFGWGEGLIAEGWETIGFDIVDMHAELGIERDERFRLVIQDVLTLHGKQFKDVDLIVASPPCQAYSYRAMPWKRAKALPPPSNALFDACFRIQREACEAAGHHIPLVVENVRGAQPWVGRARWNFGSFYLWGDVPALMPIATKQHVKVPGLNWSDFGKPGYKAKGFNTTADQMVREDIKNTGGSWFKVSHNKVCGNNTDGRKTSGLRHIRDGSRSTPHLTNQAEHVKQGGDWFSDSEPGSLRSFSSKSTSKKRASAMIAKIPFVLSSWIAKVYLPCKLSA